MIIKNDLDLEDEETEATEPTEEEEETITNYVYYINGSMEWVKDITVNNINKVKDWLDNDYLTYGRIRNHTFESLARLVPIHPNSLNTVVRVLAFRKKPIISFKSKSNKLSPPRTNKSSLIFFCFITKLVSPIEPKRSSFVKVLSFIISIFLL